MLKSLSLPNLPVRLDARVVKYLKFYRDNPRGRSIVRVWAQKSGKYAPSIQAELGKAGLPTDLVWLSLIESGHTRPSNHRPEPWAFGSSCRDGAPLRLDGGSLGGRAARPRRSTEAAILYLSDLKKRFGTWELAIAATTWAFGGLGKAIRKYNTNDFWQLGRHEAGIPWETTLYVPKILATAIVMNNRRAFGIADVVPAEPVAFDTVLVRPAVSLSRVAAAAQVGLADIEELNPHSWRRGLPGGFVEVGDVRGAVRRQGHGAAQSLAAVGDGESELGTYVVRFGDTPRCISSDLGISEQQLERLNGLGDGETLEAGRYCWCREARTVSKRAIRRNPWWSCRRRSSLSPIGGGCSSRTARRYARRGGRSSGSNARRARRLEHARPGCATPGGDDAAGVRAER